MSVTLATDMTVLPLTLPDVTHTLVENDDQTSILTFFMPVPLTPGSSQSYRFTVYFTPDTRDGAGADADTTVLQGHIVTISASGTMDLTSTPGERSVTETIPRLFIIPYSSDTRPSYYIFLDGEKTGNKQASLYVDHQIAEIKTYIWRCRIPDTPWVTFAVSFNRKNVF